MRKKTLAEKQRAGTYRADRNYPTEPGGLAPVEVKLPKYLSKDPHAREFWKRVVDPLNEQGVLIASDLASMETLASMYSELRTAQELAAESPATIEYSNGNPGAHPDRKRADDLASRFLRALNQAGLTPAQHSKLEVLAPAEAEEDDGMYEILYGGRRAAREA